MFYCSVGKQQWGDIVDGTNKFAIAFTDFCRMTNCGSYTWDGADNIIRSIALINFTASYEANAHPFLYIAIGKQQWGEYDVSAIGADTSTTTIVPLLISMANTNYVVCISKHKIGTAWSYTSPTLTEKELEKFTVVTWNNYSGSAQPTTQMYLLVGQ